MNAIGYSQYGGTVQQYIREHLDPDNTLGESPTSEEEARAIWAGLEESFADDGGTGIDEEAFVDAVAEMQPAIELLGEWDGELDAANEALAVTEVTVGAGWHGDTPEPDEGWEKFFSEAKQIAEKALSLKFPNAKIDCTFRLFGDADEADNGLWLEGRDRKKIRSTITAIVGTSLQWDGDEADWVL